MKLAKGRKRLRIPKKVYKVLGVAVLHKDGFYEPLAQVNEDFIHKLPTYYGTPRYFAVDTFINRIVIWPTTDKMTELKVQYLPQPEEF